MKFQKCQKNSNTVQHQLIQAVSTRWNSVYLMFERFLEQKAALVLFLAEEPNFSMSFDDWTNMKIFMEILEPLFQFTVEICAEKMTTCSKVIPIIKILRNFYSNNENYADGRIASFKRNIHFSLMKRFGDCEAKKTYAIATMLDPRFKALGFHSQKLIDVDKMVINEALEVESLHSKEAIDENDETETMDMATPTPKGSNLWAIFDSKVSKQQKNRNSNKSEMEIELKKFKALPNLPRSDDPLKWWELSGKTLFPKLYNTAIKYLIIPATSVPAERVFSKAGSVLTKKRNRLGPKTANMIITLNSNMDLF